MLEVDLAFVQRDIKLGLELVGNRARSDSAEHLTIFTGLDGDHTNELGQTFGQLGHGIEVVRLAFSAPLLEGLQPPFVGRRQRDSQPLWKQIIAGVTGRDFHLVRFTAQVHNIVRENNFSLCHKISKN
jgi:hypothetical protein